MRSTKRMSFHESSVVAITQANTQIQIALEGVKVDGAARRVQIELSGVSSIIRNDLPFPGELKMEMSDGEIFTLEYAPDSLRMIVEWNDFKHHMSKTDAYRIEFEKLNIEVQ